MRRFRFRRRAWKRAGAAILFLGFACLFARLLFSGNLAGEISGLQQPPGYWGRRSARAAAALWRYWYPAYAGRDSKIEKDKARSPEDWLMNFILKQVPYYTEKKGEDFRNSGEPDPAFSNYLESHKVLKEYEYLVQNLSESAVLASGKNPLAAGKDSRAQAGESSRSGADDAEGIWEKGWAEGDGRENSGLNGQNAENRKLLTSQSAGNRILERSDLSVTGKKYIADQLADYDFLMKHFYTVHPTTTAGRDMMKAGAFLSEDFSLERNSGSPQILIYHTHSQEEFADFHQGNEEATIVGVGSYLTELLEAKGYHVVHDTSVYDLRDGKLDRSRAYTYALDGITGILQKYPSIQVVLDIHRDGVKEGTRLVSKVNGKKTATIMFFNGTSQTPSGPIEYLKNPYRAGNMAFSFQMKLCADAYFPGFTRKIYLKGLRYNMHLRPRSALIEVGAQTNTYEEARNAMEPLAELLDLVLRPVEEKGTD